MNDDLFLSDDEINYSSTSFPKPRPFQDTAHEKLRQGARDGHRCQIIMAPTGSGKTYLSMRIAHEALKKGKTAVFVCDRTTLIDQTSNVADCYGLSAHSVIQSNHWRYKPKMRFHIASIQTLSRRSWPDADVIIIDECHTMYKGWTEHIKKCRANVIGLTATAFAKGLGLLFSNLINAATMHELTESGVLVPMKVFSCTQINMDGAEILGGEWSDNAAASRGMEIIGDVVAEWIQYASDRKTIVFGATIEHCEVMAKQFNESGIKAEVFTSHTTPEQREVILKEYKKEDSLLRVLISVEALAKGFDVKDVGCVCDCRPLRKSLSTAIQMWGRGLRASPDTGKTDCILLDFSGNIIRFAEDYEDIFFNGLEALDHGEKLDKTVRNDDEEEKEPCECPRCKEKPFFNRCMHCGYEKVAKTLIEHLPGQMQEIKIGKSHAADNAYQLYQMCCTYARQKGNPETQKGRAYHMYRDIMGSDPKWYFDQTPNVPISRAVYNKIMQRNIAFAKGMAKGARA